MWVFGNKIRSGYDPTGVLVVEPKTSMSGNTIIRSGIGNQDGSWTQSLHIALIPREREELIKELQDINPKVPSLTDSQFRSLLDLFMCSDPWPVSDQGTGNGHDTIKSLLDTEAKIRGYLDWVGAYHEFKSEGSTP